MVAYAILSYLIFYQLFYYILYHNMDSKMKCNHELLNYKVSIVYLYVIIS